MRLPTLRRLVLDKTGQDVYRCQGCSLCDIIEEEQDIPLYSLIQLTVLRDEEVLTSRTLWSDKVLSRATGSCAREIDLSRVILALRAEALRRGISIN